MKLRKRVESIKAYESHRAQHDGNQFYSTPEGFMPSVTTVLRDDSRNDGWRKYKGEKQANAILQAASLAGPGPMTLQNTICGLMRARFSLHLPAVVDLDQTVSGHDRSHPLTEGALWNSDNYAGACDCVAYLKPCEMFPDADINEPVLIDFKTANKPIRGTKLYIRASVCCLCQSSQLCLPKERPNHS